MSISERQVRKLIKLTVEPLDSASMFPAGYRHMGTHGQGVPNVPVNNPALPIQLICSPLQPEICVAVTSLPALHTISCTSCGVSGAGPLEFNKSNASKWGAVFVWIYCHQCMSAFGTISEGVLRTYRSTPKDNSPTGRLRRSQQMPVQVPPPAVARPLAIAPRIGPQRTASKLPTGLHFLPKVSENALSSTPLFLPDFSPSTASTSPPVTPVKPKSKTATESASPDNPFMATLFDAKDSGTHLPSIPQSKKGGTAPSPDGESDRERSTNAAETKFRSQRDMDINLQMMDGQVVALEFTLTLNKLKWGDLPVLIRNHLQSQNVARSLEVLLRPGGLWRPFGFRDTVPINPAVNKIYARVVSAKQSSPHEIIVLASDSDEVDEPPPRKRKRVAEVTVNAKKAAGSAKGRRKEANVSP